VDDNPIHQQIAARIFEIAGATVTVAGNGEQQYSSLDANNTTSSSLTS